jgi:hypothetical protein
MTGYDTSPSGISAAGSRADMVLRDAKAGSAKGTSGTYSDQPAASQVGPGGIASRAINKAATPKPSGSTSDTGRDKP